MPFSWLLCRRRMWAYLSAYAELLKAFKGASHRRRILRPVASWLWQLRQKQLPYRVSKLQLLRSQSQHRLLRRKYRLPSGQKSPTVHLYKKTGERSVLRRETAGEGGAEPAGAVPPSAEQRQWCPCQCVEGVSKGHRQVSLCNRDKRSNIKPNQGCCTSSWPRHHTSSCLLRAHHLLLISGTRSCVKPETPETGVSAAQMMVTTGSASGRPKRALQSGIWLTTVGVDQKIWYTIFEIDFGFTSTGRAVWKGGRVKYRVVVVHINHAIARTACRSEDLSSKLRQHNSTNQKANYEHKWQLKNKRRDAQTREADYSPNTTKAHINTNNQPKTQSK